MQTVRRLEFLYWADCPSHPDAWNLLQEVLAEEGLDLPVARIEVQTDHDAEVHSFPGSPTIRVNGVDLDPAGATRMGTALTCRVYILEDGRYSPVPSKNMIRQAVTKAAV